MPIAIGAGVILVVGLGILFFSHPALADAPATPGRKPATPAPTHKPPAVVLHAAQPAPRPMPDSYYQIEEGDTGTELCVECYHADRPYAAWLRVAADPRNTQRIGLDWKSWFLPRWSADGKSYTGAFTGHYALVYFPKVVTK
jgi:hypothetical protein